MPARPPRNFLLVACLVAAFAAASLAACASGEDEARAGADAVDTASDSARDDASAADTDPDLRDGEDSGADDAGADDARGLDATDEPADDTTSSDTARADGADEDTAADAEPTDGGDDARDDVDSDTAGDAGCRVGTRRPAGDGCNTCQCIEGGVWACTEIACEGRGCSDDADCMETGCSGQICASESVDTTCEWRDEYACYDNEYTRCGCFEGRCAWDDTDRLRTCLADPPSDAECVEGTRRTDEDGCNTCVCTAEGTWACTDRACPEPDCSRNVDCVVTGCSSQLCASEEMATTCEWREEYACYREPHTVCGCFDGRCGWEDTEALRTCVEERSGRGAEE